VGDESGAAILIEGPKHSGERLPRRKVSASIRAAVLAVATLCLAGANQAAFAQIECPNCPTPPPVVTPEIPTGLVQLSAQPALFDITSHFLRRLGDQATAGAAVWKPPSPDGGGADAEVAAAQRYRAWTELYGMTAHTGAKANFTGDRRNAFGGIAGIGATVTPGVNLAFSADQSQTRIRITGLPQSATLDMTQLGGQGSFELGAFTLGLAGVYGFGHVESSRTAISGGTSLASYGAQAWAALGELSYLWQIGNSRVVPKLGMDWTRTETDPFTEAGGALPISATGQVSERTRAFIATEFGHTWLADRTIYDATVYVRLIDNLRQDISTVQATTALGPAAVVSITGIKESRYGFDGGATFSIKPTAMTRLYAMYDVRLRDGYDLQIGTLGLEVRW
jgi:uncharacterized protein with beta-barrel porin domain